MHLLRHRADLRSLIFGMRQRHLMRPDCRGAAVIELAAGRTEFVHAVRSLNPFSATYQVNAASQMRFSVIIPTFKRAQLLSDAIRAVLAQTYTNREILVIDDGSPDDTRNVASTFGEAVRYLRQENKGKSAALNLGISASTGDAIIVLDDDDLFPPWTVAKHAEALERNAGADFSFGRFVRFSGDWPPSPTDLRDEEFVPTHDPRRLVVKLMENCFLP